MTLDAPTVADVRTFVPLLRELRAAGFVHATFGSMVYGSQHSWVTPPSGSRESMYLDLDAGGVTIVRTAPLEVDEFTVRLQARLTPDQVRSVLVTFGVLDPEPRP
jgi:hypothetical protein